MVYAYRKILTLLESKNIVTGLISKKKSFSASVFYMMVAHVRHGNESVAIKGYASKNEKKAFQRILGEMVERSAFMTFAPNTLLETGEKITQKKVLPTEYLGCFGSKNIFNKIKYDWILAKDLKGRDIYIPFQPHTYNQNSIRGSILKPASSSGCAAGSTVNSAILAGIYELLERDAYAKALLGNFILGKLDKSTVPDSVLNQFDEILDFLKVELHLAVLPTRSGIDSTSIAAVLVNQKEKRSVIGLKTNVSIKQAIIGAVEEAVSTYLGPIIYSDNSDSAWRKLSLAHIEIEEKTPFLNNKHILSYKVLKTKERRPYREFLHIKKQLMGEGIRMQYVINTTVRLPGFVSVFVDSPDLLPTRSYRYNTPDVLQYVNDEKKKITGTSNIQEASFTDVDPFF